VPAEAQTAGSRHLRATAQHTDQQNKATVSNHRAAEPQIELSRPPPRHVRPPESVQAVAHFTVTTFDPYGIMPVPGPSHGLKR